MNTMRVFLHNLLWQQDSPAFFAGRINFFKSQTSTIFESCFVLLDSVWDPYRSSAASATRNLTFTTPAG